MTDHPPDIELRDVSIAFKNKRLFKNLNLTLHKHEHLTLTGRSGSGKTTVLHAILGFIEPEEGQILIAGETMTPQTVWTMRTRMAWIAQEPQLGQGIVNDILEQPFQYKANAHKRDNLERTDQLMERFHLLSDLKNESVENLSGGEKQRIAIISALLLDRDIILLDEASSALDSESKTAVADWFRQQSDLTILSISHDSQGFDIGGRTIDITSEASEEGPDS